MSTALIWSIIIGNLMVGTVFRIAQSPEKDNPLAKFTWQKRVLILFMPVASDRTGVTQLNLLTKNPAELTERDLEIVVVAGNKVEKGRANAAAGTALRQQFKVPEKNYMMILIGKDGGEKYRTQKVVGPTVIFNIIDAMPMRQSEINQEKGL